MITMCIFYTNLTSSQLYFINDIHAWFVFLLYNINLLDAAGCDVTFTVTETKQYIATEGYPNYYKNNQDCEFNFIAPSGRKVLVLFEDFNLENHFDYLYFRKLHKIDAQTHTHTHIYTHTHR